MNELTPVPVFQVKYTKVRVRKGIVGYPQREDEIMIGRDDDGRCYLLAAVCSKHGSVVNFLGETEHIEISKQAYDALAAMSDDKGE